MILKQRFLWLFSINSFCDGIDRVVHKEMKHIILCVVFERDGTEKISYHFS